MTTSQQIRELLADRILIIDGAMGTMIQRHKLTEAEYRGERLADHPVELKSNSEVVSLVRPEIIEDTLVAKAALFAIQRHFAETGARVPVMASVTVTDRSGRTLSGQTLEAFWISISHMDLLSVGINCALGPGEMRPYVEELSRLAPIYVTCYPNAGLPNPLSETGFDATPESMAPILHEFAENGWLNMVGGCCGTTPAHIRAIAEAVAGCPPRPLPQPPRYTRFSGLEPLVLRPAANFTLIGERTNVTGPPRVARRIQAGAHEAGT